MKKFKFKLQNVLNYRETLENLAKNNYSEALRVLNLERGRLVDMEDRKSSLKDSYKIKAGSIVNADDLTFVSGYMTQLLFLIEKQKELIAEKETISQKKFEEWNEKRKDVKVIHRLKEKKWNEYLKETDKEDQTFQDEIFIAKTIRSKVVES
ncbi:MAG: flagellar export protein FliJ [bacterium]|nr:flagellar export protein FliJ [bacterium]